MAPNNSPSDDASGGGKGNGNGTTTPRATDPLHELDMTGLWLGYPPASHKNVDLNDLQVTVHGLEEIKNSTRPIAVVLLTHAWAGKNKHMYPMATALLGEANRLEKQGLRKRTRDLLVVTLDQRNHGDRRRVKGLLDFATDPMSVTQMAIALKGINQDLEIIMNFLPSVLWHNKERDIVEYIPCGISMGGHNTWRLVRENPSVRIAIPIISIPPEMLLTFFLSSRAGKDRPLPPDIQKWYNSNPAAGTYEGKKILALHGAKDRVIGAAKGEKRMQEIIAQAHEPGDIQQWIDPNVGHVVSEDMVRKTAEWIWRWGLSVPFDGAKAKL